MGCGLLLVEMPKQQPVTLEQQLSKRFFPYLVKLPVKDVHSYAINPRGQFDSVQIYSTMMIEGVLQTVVRGWDAQNWWVHLNGEFIEGDQHGLGVCPVLPFVEGDIFPSTGTFSQIADIGKRIFNMQSELDEILRGQTFSILCYNIPESQLGQVDFGKLSESVGIYNMLVYSGAAAPSFATPPTGPSEIYLKSIASLEQKIKDIALSIDFTATSKSESGVALNIRFQKLNAALSSFARKAEDFERRMFDMACRWLKIENNTTVSYPKSFEIADVQAELTALTAYQTGSFPAEVIQEKQKQIIALDFSNLEGAELQGLLDAVDAVDPETPLIESRLAVLEGQMSSAVNTQPQGTPQGMPMHEGIMQ